MSDVHVDYYGHPSNSTLGVSAAYTGATTGSAAGTIVAGGTIVTAAPGNINCNDQAGSFTVVSASSAAGLAASVFFAQPYPANPKSVQVTAFNTTSSAAITAGVAPVSGGLNSGFEVYLGTTTSTDTYTIYYHVQP
jgi:hypothetical protein